MTQVTIILQKITYASSKRAYPLEKMKVIKATNTPYFSKVFMRRSFLDKKHYQKKN